MNLIKQVEKICGDRYGVVTPNVSDREYDRIVRQLMCRLIDVEELFPGEYKYYEDVSFEYLPDFLRGREDRDYSYAVESPRANVYKLVVTDWSTDHRVDTVIKIPKFILEDNWYDNVDARIAYRRIKQIDQEITKIEEIIKNGPEQIAELNKEKTELQAKIESLNHNIDNGND